MNDNEFYGMRLRTIDVIYLSFRFAKRIFSDSISL